MKAYGKEAVKKFLLGGEATEEFNQMFPPPQLAVITTTAKKQMSAYDKFRCNSSEGHQKRCYLKEYPPKELKKLSSILITLKENKWLNAESEKILKGDIQLQLVLSPKGANYFTLRALTSFVDTKGRPEINPFLKKFIIVLLERTREKYGKPQFPLVASFLFEQGISGMTEDNIRKIYKRRNEKIKNLHLDTRLKLINFIMTLPKTLPDNKEVLPSDFSAIVSSVFKF